MYCIHINYLFYCLLINKVISQINPQLTKVWGPGLYPDQIVMPARYFFIQAVDIYSNNLTTSPGDIFQIEWKGQSINDQLCRININKLDLNDGTFIIRYKLYSTCFNSQLHIKYNEQHLAESPYIFTKPIQSEQCNCPDENFQKWFQQYKCHKYHKQLDNDLLNYQTIDFNLIRGKLIKKLNQPKRNSFCNYVIKYNEIYRNCYGEHTGFKIFMDQILLSLARKVKLPDIELFMNLGDWPLIQDDNSLPMFSWCGSNDTYDITLPTYDITQATLENMGGVMLDMLSVQSEANKFHWSTKIDKLFWRGRDSHAERLHLIDIARENHTKHLFNVSLTNFFFYRDRQDQYGPKSAHISFFDFFQYKYQLNIDGTVAAYRLPYLLAGNSVVFKTQSKYYEYFYTDLQAMVHFIPVAGDLHDLVERIQWAIKNDGVVQQISLAGRQYAREHLMPHDIYCYYALVLNEWSARIVSDVNVIDGMEHVVQPSNQNQFCYCSNSKDEL